MVECPPPVRRSVKRVYAELVGMFGARGSRVERPDWQLTVMDLALVNLRRRLDKARGILGLSPFRIQTDAVWFTTDDPDPQRLATAMGTGAGMGLMHHVETLTADEYTARLAGGGRK
jgi:hypothetical protein